MKITKKKIIIFLVILALVALAFWIFSDREPENTTVEAAVKDLKEEVFATGTVASRQEVNLAFEKAGRIQSIAVAIGDVVRPGQVLATLDRGVELAALRDAEASLAGKEADLAELKRGTRAEQISVTESKLAKALQSIAIYKESIPETLDNASTKAETAVYQYTENIFYDDRSSTPRLIFQTADYSAKSSAESGRVSAEAALGELVSIKLSSKISSPDPALLAKAKTLLFTIQDFLIATTNAVNFAIINDSDKVTYKTDLATARGETNTAITAVTTLAQNIALGEAESLTSKRQLELEKAGSTPEEIQKAEAEVASARALVQSAEATLSQKTMLAPIAGTITARDADPGEIIGVNEPILTIINTDAFEIEAFLPEADVAAIRKGQRANVTLDAYGSNLVFEAEVISVDPASTKIEGIPTYKTIFALKTADERIKSGMTANLTIEISAKPQVLAIPGRAIRYDEQKRPYVLVQTGEKSEEKREVEIGLKGTFGDVEIISGLQDGDTVILQD